MLVWPTAVSWCGAEVLLHCNAQQSTVRVVLCGIACCSCGVTTSAVLTGAGCHVQWLRSAAGVCAKTTQVLFLCSHADLEVDCVTVVEEKQYVEVES